MHRLIRSLALIALVAAPSPALAERDPWTDIVAAVFGGREMVADDVIAIEAPNRAEDAALVPITLTTSLPEDDGRTVETITLVIDENPAPVAAIFRLGPDAGVTSISARVRVERYTKIHAVAELSDGSQHVAEHFIKASGGCAAPMAKDAAAALASLGEMRLRWFEDPAAATASASAPMSPAEMQVMIRHPNNSGLQIDQLTRHYIPAYFVHDLVIRQGDDVVLRMEGGISISEDPNLRISFVPTGEPIRVEATDTKGGEFRGEWPAGS